ncbi:MAG: TMEM175 family protein, partial [Sphingobacterium sp.]
MTKSRLEAFSDGVLAIIITIMVLELKVPEGYTFASLKPLYPKIISYIVSFIYVGLYWNNHHHLFQIVRKVNGKVLWGNLHLLFWLSLMPVTTNWIGESHFER